MRDDQEFRLFHELPKRLHSGEASSLAIAYHRQWHFMTDDRAARTQAKQLGISLSGSLGCLILAIEHHICTLEQANEWLARMIEEHKYRSPVSDLTPLLNQSL